MERDGVGRCDEEGWSGAARWRGMEWGGAMERDGVGRCDGEGWSGAARWRGMEWSGAMDRDGVGRRDAGRASRCERTRDADPCLSPFVVEVACENVKQRL
jgi:hypothetical protein